MNKEKIAKHLAQSMRDFPEIEVIRPGELSPKDTAGIMIGLLNSVYAHHAISSNPSAIEKDIASGKLQTWIAKNNGDFVATSSLIKTENGEVELGRAVSKLKGAGKILMDSAALSHLSSTSSAPIIAEVRVANKFWDVPSGAATQHLCFELFNLVPHAIAPFFAHGSPKRNESFVLARSDRHLNKTVSELAFETITGRSMVGKSKGLKIIQTEPFNIAIPDENCNKFEEFSKSIDLHFREGFTLFPLETTDSNLPLIGELLSNPRIVVCGVEHGLGKNNKPIILLGTIGADTKIADTKITEALPQPLRRDLQNIADTFTRLGDQNPNTIGHGESGFWRDKDGKIWGNWS